MARDFAKLLTRVWHDPDWTGLTSLEQAVYAALLTTDDLSWCGVAPLLPQRLQGYAADLTEAKARRALATLEARRFVVTDYDAGEVSVRSFVRNDKVMSQPNIVRAMHKALQVVRSEPIHNSILTELARSWAEDPGLKGWTTLRLIDPDMHALVTKGSAKGSANPFGNPSAKGLERAS